jgi:hypothetical protein
MQGTSGAFSSSATGRSYRFRRRTIAALLIAALSSSWSAHARETLRVLDINLEPLIEQAAREPARFAVEIPHAARLEDSGQWQQVGDSAHWSYFVRVPDAVSLSFHAIDTSLPAGAALTVRSGATHFTYSAGDVRNGELWSRILKGDTLAITLDVPLRLKRSTRFAIVGLQAGYRTLGSGGANHPAYNRVRARTAASQRENAVSIAAAGPNDSCVENFQCNITAANEGPGRSSVALVIANAVQCTGTLVNNARQDGVPYILTARHCQAGANGQPAPQNAASVSVYWNATTPCGDTLGDIYSPVTTIQSGATTIVEQQDLWLIRLTNGAGMQQPYFAGIDATGGAINGGYSAHHALSRKKQLTEWFGQALSLQMSGSSLGVPYTSDFLATSSQRGFFGPGASGSALFDQNNRVVGTASRGRETNGGPGACPVTPVAQPTESTATALYTSLAATWTSTADSTSSTGSTTLASVLDPDGTGTRSFNGAANLVQLILRGTTTSSISGTAPLSWDATGATSCVGELGEPGDGWAGPQSTGQGTDHVTSSRVGPTTYRITCNYPSGRVSSSTWTINWTEAIPVARFEENWGSAWVGAPVTMRWTSNVGPCSISAGDPDIPTVTNLPAEGSAPFVFTKPSKDFGWTVSLTCAGNQLAVATWYAAHPVVDLKATATDRKVGQFFNIDWNSYADYCTPSGGDPDDGWKDAQRGRFGSYRVTPTRVGTYVYTLTCTQAHLTAQNEITVKVTDDAPYATLAVSNTRPPYLEYFTIQVRSNLEGCYLYGLGGSSGGAGPVWLEKDEKYLADRPGTWNIQAVCTNNGLTASSAVIPVVIEMPVPPVNIGMGSSNAFAPNRGLLYTVTWVVSDATSCTASGHALFNGTVPTNGQVNINVAEGETVRLTLSCTGEGAPATRELSLVGLTPPPPASGGSSDSGGGGGGGVFDLLALAALGLIVALRELRRRHDSSSRFSAARVRRLQSLSRR